ncbi:histidine phosphatase family protein [Pararobbsia alpina]|uniref:Phosphoserine phosphatase 1 n=1 Tax=Pararobbsia alpina TaxID=621374 RepID=A0A6S7AYP9_9BURK|nr:histidine phosphatase family protein [Pararobbsia alpina]CAB3779714.1 Phosphoserine phosphatase 1 [Pararobbsia alpina]
MPTTMILIRHGETSWNAIKRIQGFTDIPLNELGLRQAAELGERFARSRAAGSDLSDSLAASLNEADAGGGLDRKPVAAIYVSDLQRARQTAAPVGRALGLVPVPMATLRERNYGCFEGLDPSEIESRYPEQFIEWQSRDPEFGPDNGESPRVFHDRVVAALRGLAARHPDERLVVVAHGGVLDNARRYALSLALGRERDYLLLNASINIVKFTATSAQVIRWADVSHLEGSEARDDTRAVQVDTRVL